MSESISIINLYFSVIQDLGMRPCIFQIRLQPNILNQILFQSWGISVCIPCRFCDMDSEGYCEHTQRILQLHSTFWHEPFQTPFGRAWIDKHLEVTMAFWQRLLITVLVMLVTSFIVGAIWRSTFNMIIPSYIAGVIAGLAALPVWELLKRIKPKKEKNLHSANR